MFIERIEILQDFGTLRRGTVVPCDKPVVVLLGRNGSGKSGVLDAIAEHAGVRDTVTPKRVNVSELVRVEGEVTEDDLIYYDGHADNKKFATSLDDDDMAAQIMALRHSSGESTLIYLQNRGVLQARNKLVVLDEVDTHVDAVRQFVVMRKIYQNAVQNGCQLFVATHGTLTLQWLSQQDGVTMFDMEKQEPTDSSYFNYLSRQALRAMGGGAVEFIALYNEKVRQLAAEMDADEA